MTQARTAGGGSEAKALPELRRELRLSEGAVDASGHRSLLVFDPIRNLHFRFDHPAATVVANWRAIGEGTYRQALAREHGIETSAAELAEIVEFLHANELTTADRERSWRGIAARAAAGRRSLGTRLLHEWLFFRIPLVDPDRLLDRVVPKISPLIGPKNAWGVAGLLVVAVFLISRRWDVFVADASAAFTPDALPAYAVVLFLLKCVHEIGHAVAAKRFGGHVPTMGVAFMLGVPMLYTDTSDAWRLADRRQRLAVVLAGVGAESIVAVAALFLWSFLPEGGARQTACALAGMSLFTSFALNLNPCMRFDGYFALSDLLDVPNLQDRAFALGRERMRRVLLGTEERPVVDMAPGKVDMLVAWAWATWIYRLGLYTGIAAMVYAMSFKVVGLLLFAFEIVWFMARPFWREARAWWDMRAEIRHRSRARTTAIVAMGLLVLTVLPWSRVVEAPAVRIARDEAVVHASLPARIAERLVEDGAEVEKGAAVLRLEAPALEAQRQRVAAEIAAIEARLALAPSLVSEREAAGVLSTQLAAAREKLAGLARLGDDLVLRAPMSGVVVDLDPGLRNGVWINPGQDLLRVVSPTGVGVRALVEEGDVRRLSTGSKAVFVSEAGTGARTQLRVVAIAENNERHIAEAALADVAGGSVATSGEAPREGPIPRGSLFTVTLSGEADAPLLLERGTVRIAATGEAPLTGAVRRVARVLTRESGF